MRYNKVLLVSPPTSSRYGGLRVPAGIGYVAQALYDNNIDYQYLDMRIGYSHRQLMQKIKLYKPALIGISMITLEYINTYKLIENIKSNFPNIKIVVGGHHVTILKSKVLEECSSIDYGVIHDGEDTLVELCESKLSINEIKGLIYRKKTNVIDNGERIMSKHLDSYSFPKYINFKMSDYSNQIPVHSSRGCVGLCTFCPNKLLGKKFRVRSIKNFVDEIEYWRNRGYTQFAIDDDNFTLIKKRVLEFCDEIENRGLNDLLIRCSNGIRADRVDKEMLTRMMDVGVKEVGFGVDGGNDNILRSLKKGESMDVIDNAVKIACDLGLDVKIFIIVGTPFETAEDVNDSIKFALKYPVARVNFNNAIPYPGTEMYDYVKENNLFIIPPEIYLNEVTEEKEYPVFATPAFTEAERKQMLKKCHDVEETVMKNTAIRMFRNIPMAAFLIKHFFSVDLFEKLFFHNLFIRKVMEWIRYKKLQERKVALSYRK